MVMGVLGSRLPHMRERVCTRRRVRGVRTARESAATVDARCVVRACAHLNVQNRASATSASPSLPRPWPSHATAEPRASWGSGTEAGAGQASLLHCALRLCMAPRSAAMRRCEGRCRMLPLAGPRSRSRRLRVPDACCCGVPCISRQGLPYGESAGLAGRWSIRLPFSCSRSPCSCPIPGMAPSLSIVFASTATGAAAVAVAMVAVPGGIDGSISGDAQASA